MTGRHAHRVREDAAPSSPLRVVPYCRDTSPALDLLLAWEFLRQYQLCHRVFYAQHAGLLWQGDLLAVLEYLTQTVLWHCWAPDGLAGLVWFTECTAKQGNIGIAYRPQSRGARAVAATQEVCRQMFAATAWQAIWGFTPWRSAVAHGRAVGFAQVATLPQFVWHGDQARTITVLRMERASCPLSPTF